MEADTLKLIEPEVLQRIKSFLEDRQKKHRNMNPVKLTPVIANEFNLKLKQASVVAYAWHEYQL